jgi:hypothetical protein
MLILVYSGVYSYSIQAAITKCHIEYVAYKP